MYNTSYFKENDRQTVLEFLDANPLAFLTGSTKTGEQVATQVPILAEERNGKLFLCGHMMRNSDHHKAFAENQQVLALFTGPHAYVSASWYTNPQSGSTWNYMSVHANGKIKFMSQENLIAFMQKLSLKFEKGNMDSPTVYDNLPDTYVNKMLQAIDGFEIEVEKLDNVFKLSQNRDEESYRNIIHQLEKQDGNARQVAEEMKRRMGELFSNKQS